MTDIIEKIVTSITNNRKYHSLAPRTVQRIVEDAARRFPEKQIENEAKRKLHQIWGAYYSTRPNFQKLQSKIEEEIQQGKNLKTIFLPLLQIHSSTNERLPILEDFYTKIFAVTGHPTSIIDHAVGLNALTVPWMQLPATSHYTARDIDQEEVLFENFIFENSIKNNNLHSEVGDLFEELPTAQIHFLFKILPLLEQQKKGASAEILNKLKGKYLVISYPTATLTGRNKGMTDNYAMQFEQLIQHTGWKTQKIEFLTEVVYIIEK